MVEFHEQSDKKIISKERFFNRFWELLDQKGWRGIILHSWKYLPAKIESDVDYAVAGCNPRELLDFLNQFSRKHGWKLVQVIEHEPLAYFCVCMQDGGGFEQIALDVTWDYRRLGHHLISSALLQDGVRVINGKSFKVPSPGAEAAYILAKAAAKNKKFEEVEFRLKELCEEDFRSFSDVLKEALGFQCEKKSAEEILNDLKGWYRNAKVFKPVRGGRRYGFSEIKLYLRRCLQPTGLWLGFPESESKAKSNLVEEALKPIRPLYRRSKTTGTVSPFAIPKIIGFVIRTSLLIENGAQKKLMAGLFREMIVTVSPDDPGEVTREILACLNERVTRRILKL